ncbi:corticotropin-releasing factor-binding protein [Teleopsis dalmanni]|uniref:corticotropin-releasing factor-binding protein n=1 Tax=Teleopsis dalmanni TaxID=139649 RepID=UPI0018CFB656|nr:corticotropin-releasing factor-binding protein [Teleopsis dalmanni]
MKAVVFFSLTVVLLSAKAWPTAKKSFDLYPETYDLHKISDCMHITSEPGDYVFKKTAHVIPSRNDASILEIENSMEVCGLYVIGEPDTIIELTVLKYDINCETGGLMAFVDGWELNGEYFPGLSDHHRLLKDRVIEFCNNYRQWPVISNKKFFRSSQNAALLQYRIPLRGSFIVNIRYHKISQPCHVLVHDTTAIMNIANFGHRRNCTISALFPATVSVINLKVGGKSVRQEKVNYDCSFYEDRLEIGGTSGLESIAMEKSSEICGFTNEQGPEQAIFCGVTTVRLVSTGRYQNQAAVAIRKAEEIDLEIATLICAI